MAKKRVVLFLWGGGLIPQCTHYESSNSVLNNSVITIKNLCYKVFLLLHYHLVGGKPKLRSHILLMTCNLLCWTQTQYFLVLGINLSFSFGQFLICFQNFRMLCYYFLWLPQMFTLPSFLITFCQFKTGSLCIKSKWVKLSKLACYTYSLKIAMVFYVPNH